MKKTCELIKNIHEDIVVNHMKYDDIVIFKSSLGGIFQFWEFNPDGIHYSVSYFGKITRDRYIIDKIKF